MKTSHHAMLITLFSLFSSTAVFADRAEDLKAEAESIAKVEGASISITTPIDGVQLDANEEYSMIYEVALGNGGDHFHVWVDDQKGPGIHNTKGTYTIPKLLPGEHKIYIQIVDKGHVGTGPTKSIIVNAVAEAKS